MRKKTVLLCAVHRWPTDLFKERLWRHLRSAHLARVPASHPPLLATSRLRAGDLPPLQAARCTLASLVLFEPPVFPSGTPIYPPSGSWCTPVLWPA